MRKILSFILFLFSAFMMKGVQAQNNDNATAIALVTKNATAIGLSPDQLSNFKVSSTYFNAIAGNRMVYLLQTYKGLPVYNQMLVLAFKEDKLVSHAGEFLSNMDSRSNMQAASPSRTAADAVRAAITETKLEMPGAVTVMNTLESNRKFDFGKMNISSQNVTAELMWVPVRTGNEVSVKLAWEVQIAPIKKPDYWNIRVDASTNTVIEKSNYTVYDQLNHSAANQISALRKPTLPQPQIDFNYITDIFSTKGNSPSLVTTVNYRVVPYPAESPIHPGGTPAIRTNPWTLAGGNAVSLGWHNDGTLDYIYTRGNNVWAKEDRAGNNSNAGLPATSTTSPDPLNFDFAPNFNVDPTQRTPVPNQQFNTTNLFYWNNILHDITYNYGFTEPAGNFQASNQGRGGLGNDFVYGDAQDGSGTNNANFATPPDGGNGRMQMYLFNGVTTMTVNSPPVIAGNYTAVEGAMSTANLLINVGPVTNQVVYYNDDAGGTAHLACGPPANSVTGKIALIIRGTCAFAIKVKNAQNAGAVAVIMVNNVPGAPIIMGGADNTITIPAVMISDVDGATIAAQLANNVNVTLAAGPNLDGDVDNGVVTHEFFHGVSTRLTGGPANSSCLNNAEEGGEGWSDYNSLMLTTNWATALITDGVNKPRPIGTYVLGQPITGAGIRSQPYCTDIAVNTHVYLASLPAEVHDLGEYWCEALWEMTWGLIQTNGISSNLFDPTGTGGNVIAYKLVIEGLKLQPCSPGFIDARNAILQADINLYGGAHWCTIYTAFAKRGMGFGASEGSSSSVTDQTPTFTLPPVNSISVQPANVSTCIGTSVNFSVTATGGGGASTYTYQWQLSTAGAGGPWNNITNGAPYSGATTATLNINPTTLAMNGYQYRCVVNGGTCGSATSNPGILTVTTPVINAPTVTQPTCAVTTGTIVVNATGSGTLEYSINGGANWFLSNTFSGLAPGNYNIQVRLQANPACLSIYASNPVVINAVPVAPTVNAPTVTQPTCAVPTGTIVVNATGSGTLEYSINGGANWFLSNTFSGLAAGNYTVQVRLQSSPTCVTSYAGNPVVINPVSGGPTVNAPTVTQPTCAVTSGTIVVNATGIGTLEYSINGGANWFLSNTFSGLAPGNYNIQVRLQAQPTCLTVYAGNPVVISAVPVAPTVNAPTVTQPTCAVPTGTIVVNATGSGTLEYSINGGANWFVSATFSGLAPGNYTIQVRLQANPTCVTSYVSNPVVINAVPTAPTVNAPTVTQPTCAVPTGTIVVNATGSGTLEYSINGGATWFLSATFSGLAPGNYNIRVRLQSSPTCFTDYAANPVVITAATGIPTINSINLTQPTCAVPTGTIVINATGIGTIEYSIDNGATWFLSNTFSGLVPGNYNVKARSQASPTCVATYIGNPVVINAVPAGPVINAPTVTQPGCVVPTGTIVVNATGSGTLEYSINNGATWFLSNTFSGLIPGNYNIQVRLQAQPTCVSSYAANPVVINAAPPAPTLNSVTVTQPTCAVPSGTIVINATGVGTLEYSINNGATWFLSNTFSGLAVGNYNVVVRLQASPTCVIAYAGNPVVINVAPGTPTVNAVPNQAVCTGSPTATVTFSGSIPGTVYNWTNNTPSIGLAASGSGNIASFIAQNGGLTPVVATITVTPSFTNGGGTCTGTPITFTITVNPNPPITIVADPGTTLCQGDPALLTVQVAPTLYTFTNASPITINAFGTATPYPAPLVVAGVPAGATVSNVKLFQFNHTWSGDVDVAITGPTFVAGGNTQAAMLLSDLGNDGFIAATNVNLTFQDGSPRVPATSPMASGTYSCTNDGAVVDAMPLPGPTTTAATPLLTQLNAATMNGTWNLWINDQVGGDGGNVNGGYSITFVVPGGPYVGPTFTWTPALGLNQTTGNPVAASPAVTTTYTVTATTGAGCIRQANITLTINLRPAVTTPPANTTVCAGAPASFTVAGVGAGLTYQWQESTTGIAGPYVSLANTAPYSGVNTATLTISPTTVAMNGYYYRCVLGGSCPPNVNSAVAKLTVNPLPVVVINPVGPVCGGVAGISGTALTASGANTYVWAPLAGLYLNNTASLPYLGTNAATVYAAPTALTSYTVTGTITATGCTNTATIAVNYTPPAPTITPSSVTMCNGDPAVKLKSSSSQSFTSTFSSGTVNITIPDGPTIPPVPVSYPATTSTINVSGIPANATMVNFRAKFNITHNYVGDLVMVLKAPNGAVFNLDAMLNKTNNPGSNFTNTIISSSGVTLLSAGAAPFTNTYKPDAVGATFTAFGFTFPGGPAAYIPTGTTPNILYSIPNGTWTVAIYDAGAPDAGVLNNWSLDIDYVVGVPATPAVWTIAPTPGANAGLFSDAAATTAYVAGTAVDSVWVKPLPFGVYNVGATVQSLPPLNAAPASPLTGGNGNNMITFNVANNNPYPMTVTGISSNTFGSGAITARAFYNVTPIAGNPGLISAANGWTLFGTANSNAVANTLNAVLTGLSSLVIPANSTYGIALEITGATFAGYNNGGAATSVYSNNGCDLIVGGNVGWGGPAAPGPTVNNPREFNGTVFLSPGNFPACTSPVKTVVVTVNTQPVVTAQPVSTAICTDKVATFTVAATIGLGSFSYQWQVSTDNGNTYNDIANGGVYSGATTGTLTITTPPVTMNGYYYRCKMQGPAPCAPVYSFFRILTVYPLPTIVIAAAPYVKLFPGLSTTLTSTVSPFAAATYTWLRNGIAVSGGNTGTLNVDVDGLGDYTLRVTDVNGCTNTSNKISITDSVSSNCFLYPNPSSGKFQVRYYSVAGNTLPRTCTVYDAKGSRVFTGTFTITAPYARMDIDLTPFGKGVFWVELGDRNGSRIVVCRAVVD